MSVGSESARLALIRDWLGGVSGSIGDVQIGIGDDAAVLGPSEGSLVLSVDACVEGVHFRRSWATWREIGRRAVAAAVSDLAAMGAKPRAALIALGLPHDFDDVDLSGLLDGFLEASREDHAPVVGGNLSAASELSITTTVCGEIPRTARPLRRSGARAGDSIYVTGTVGGAALGLKLLVAGRGVAGGRPPTRREAAFLERWRRPVPAVLIGQRIGAFATAAIDLSDGLLSDLGHLCDESRVGARIYARELPRLEGFDAVARELGADPVLLALGGGEDYELLFTAPASDSAMKLATRIGEVTDRPGVVEALDEHGNPIQIADAQRGYQHF